MKASSESSVVEYKDSEGQLSTLLHVYPSVTSSIALTYSYFNSTP
jgi:hypothetical protein